MRAVLLLSGSHKPIGTVPPSSCVCCTAKSTRKLAQQAPQVLQAVSAMVGRARRAQIIFGGGGVALLELALEMRLIGKAELVRHVGQRATSLEQQLGPIQPQVDLIGMGCLSKGLFEFADQLKPVQAADLCQLLQRQGVLNPRMNQVAHGIQASDVRSAFGL